MQYQPDIRPRRLVADLTGLPQCTTHEEELAHADRLVESLVEENIRLHQQVETLEHQLHAHGR